MLTGVTRCRLAALQAAGFIVVMLGAGCVHRTAQVPTAPATLAAEEPEVRENEPPVPGRGPALADLTRIPQDLGPLAAVAGERLNLTQSCQDRFLAEFKERYFAPWAPSGPPFDAAEARELMRKEAGTSWYGPNKQRLGRKMLRELLQNCDLKPFPSRDDLAIAVAPGHLRGLPTYLPLYEQAEGCPFDRISYPHVKLNEPLRVRHASKDGAWLFVQTGYTYGWLERRNVALVDRTFAETWSRAELVVVTRDYQAVPDGKGVGVYLAKVGTVLPLAQAGAGEGDWQVTVASAGEGGRVESRTVALPRDAGARFPLPFTAENLTRIGNQFMGQPYGWGEIYGLRDCSALLRDFFLPFGIWLPRTSADQIDYFPRRIDLAHQTARAKELLIKTKGVPLLTLLYKPGHIMLYAGEDPAGRPLVFHDAWSISLGAPVKNEAPEPDAEPQTAPAPAACVPEPRTQIIGSVALTTLEPGKELGLAPGSTLLDRITEMATITSRCQ